MTQQHEAGGISISDSGERQEFDSGAKRDTSTGKGFFVYLPARAMFALARLFEAGARKYGDTKSGPFRQNWQKGMPVSRYVDSAIRHLFGFLSGDKKDPHLINAAWNCLCAFETLCMIKAGKLPAELNDCADEINPYLEAEPDPAVARVSTLNRSPFLAGYYLLGARVEFADLSTNDGPAYQATREGHPDVTGRGFSLAAAFEDLCRALSVDEEGNPISDPGESKVLTFGGEQVGFCDRSAGGEPWFQAYTYKTLKCGYGRSRELAYEDLCCKHVAITE